MASNASDNSSDDEYNPQNSRPREHRTARKSTAQAPIQHISNYATRRQAAKIASKAIASSSFDKSMENFNPEFSQREKRKLTRKFHSTTVVRKPQGALYDDDGVHIQTRMDICDCLSEECPGCWFECIKCGSQKCGTDCRVFRKYVLDSIEYHGYDKTVKNPILIKQNKS